MKRATHNTGFLMVRAYTNSEWDICDFIIVQTDENWLTVVQTRVKAIETLKTDSQFYSSCFWDAPKGFYANTEDEVLDEYEDWCFVETDTKELDQLDHPENALDCYIMQVDGFGNVQYRANGKYSGEDFYSADIKIDQLKEIMQNNNN